MEVQRPRPGFNPGSPGARLLGAAQAREHGGYALMPEWGTQPANHYLPRRTTRMRIHADELLRADNPLVVEGHAPKPPSDAATLDDASW